MSESVEELAMRQSVHEAVCAERYGTIIGRVGRLETLIIAAAGSLLVGMAALIVTLALK